MSKISKQAYGLAVLATYLIMGSILTMGIHLMNVGSSTPLNLTQVLLIAFLGTVLMVYRDVDDLQERYDNLGVGKTGKEESK